MHEWYAAAKQHFLTYLHQMNFLNPGMLKYWIFRQESCNPIDKLGEQDRKGILENCYTLLSPRRTKAGGKDLTRKQEMILWCEMEDEQRKFMMPHRNELSDKIMGTHYAQGIGRSQFTILRGLMKFRQIVRFADPYWMKMRYLKIIL